jgi:hypothetical protein
MAESKPKTEKPKALLPEGIVKTKKFNGITLEFTEQGKYRSGRKVPFKNMKTMKALQVDSDGRITGNVVQLPWDLTVNNGVAGNQEDRIGLKQYERKGFILCVDENDQPLFSTLWDEWSEYDAAYDYRVTKANEGEAGVIGSNATTTRTMTGV